MALGVSSFGSVSDSVKYPPPPGCGLKIFIIMCPEQVFLHFIWYQFGHEICRAGHLAQVTVSSDTVTEGSHFFVIGCSWRQ